ncbi:MAG: GntR family transcriptional regulator [Clostridia bacterium]
MEGYNLSNETPKVLKHVEVYNKLYELIKDGTFPVGSQLPTEPELAEMMQVSRMTLRRSLALLQEDELVTLVRGKGNFIKKSTLTTDMRHLAGIQHPFRSCCDGKYDHIEIEFRIEVPTPAILEAMNYKTAAVVISDRWYMQDAECVGYSLSIIPIETISASGVDLNNTKELEEYLENSVYKLANTATSTFSYSTSGNFSASRHKLSQANAFILINDYLYEKNGDLMVYTKHYIPVDKFKIQISLTQS